MNFRNIPCKLLIFFVLLIFTINCKIGNAQVLVQPSVGTITSLNTGTDRIIEMIDDDKYLDKEDNKPIKIRKSTQLSKIEINQNIDIEDDSSDIEVFYPPSESKSKENSSYNDKMHNLNLNNEIVPNKNNSIHSDCNSNDDVKIIRKKDNSPKTKVMVAVGGGNLKVDTGKGGEIENKISGADVAYVRELNTSSGTLSIGGVVDYNHNSYDNNFQINNGKGKSDSLTVGIIAKQSREDGVYYEGTARIGRAKTDFYSNSLKLNDKNIDTFYEFSSPVYAGHVKLGKVVKLDQRNSSDIYGIYSFSHQDRNNIRLVNGENYKFGSIDSNRLKFGCRITTKFNDGKIYFGIAYQYETSAQIKARYSEEVISIADGKGGSGILELGYKLSANRDNTLNIDLNAMGFVGRQKGFTVQAQLLKSI